MKSFLLALLIVFVCIAPSGAATTTGGTEKPKDGKPKGKMIDFINDIAYHEVFPIKVAGKKMKASGHSTYDSIDHHDDVICACDRGNYKVYGVTASFWEPSRMVETVKTPYYFPFLGEVVTDVEGLGFKKGTNAKAEHMEPTTSKQAHFMIFPVWAMMGLIQDMLCSENDTVSLDIGYLTELDPLWQSDSLTLQIQPEALLFANQISQMACIADAVSANLWMPLDMLFWCIGGVGSMYPLTGNFANPNSLEANNGIATRLLFKLAREMLLPDKEVNLCHHMPQPILRKSIYKMHLARPVVNLKAHPFGRGSMVYGIGKNPAHGTKDTLPDEFTWILFNKSACCML